MAKSSRIIRQDGSVAASENPDRLGFSREEFTGGATPSDSRSVHPSGGQSLSGAIRPADLRDYNGPLFVINMKPDMISHDDGKGNVLRIEPSHHRDHIMQLPIEVANHPGFQRLWRTGRVQVTTDPSIEDILSLADIADDKGGILPYTMDAGQNKDLSPMECLVCQDTLFMTKEDLDAGQPALCDLHEDSASLIEQVFEGDKRIWKLRDHVLRRHL